MMISMALYCWLMYRVSIHIADVRIRSLYAHHVHCLLICLLDSWHLDLYANLSALHSQL